MGSDKTCTPGNQNMLTHTLILLRKETIKIGVSHSYPAIGVYFSK